MLLQGRSPYSLIAPLSALINGSLWPSVIGDRPSHSIYGLWLLKNSIFLKTAKIWGIENV
jgi:hypothetical protein